MYNNRKLKSIVLSMVLAAGMMLPISVSAQDAETGGGLLGNGKLYDSDGGLFSTRGLIYENEEEGFTNGNFGEPEPEYPEAPLGSGIAILIGAGLGYVALKKKEDKQ